MNRPYGWDERDYKLWSKIRTLPSYGLVNGDVNNPMLSRREIEKLIECLAANRAKAGEEK